MTIWRIGQCLIDTDSREVHVDGQRRAIAPKAFALLVLLLQNRHRVVQKDEIVRTIWHGAVLSDSVLARTVMLARRAIADGPESASPIKNLHGQGYRFVGEVAEEGPGLAGATGCRRCRWGPAASVCCPATTARAVRGWTGPATA